MRACLSIQKNAKKDAFQTGIEYSPADNEILESSNLKNFTFSVLQAATENFKMNSTVFRDSTGCIFRGRIESQSLTASNPEMVKVILVKQFWGFGFITSKEFLTGIEYLSRLDHPSLVKLLGYCLDRSHMLLAFEFMAYGSLENHLFERNSIFQPLSWNNRIKIALDAAKVLAYLHSGEVNVIVRDFKSSYILLDENYNAKLHGLELARSGPLGEEDHISTDVKATSGWFAPEYATGHLSTKCDVYAFGVLLIELLTGRRVQEVISSPWEKNLAKKCELLTMMDVEIEGQYSIDGARKVAKLAMQCLSVDPRGRPNMPKVVGALEQLLAETEPSK